VAGATWVVSNEGRAYRDGMSKAKLTARPIEKTAPAGPEQWDKGAQGVPISELEPSPPKLAATKSTPAQVPNSAAIAGARSSLPARPRIDLAKAEPAATSPADRAPGRSTGAVARPANPLVKNPFWNRPELTRAWNLADLKIDDERRLGAQLHDLIVQLNPLVEDGPWLSRVEDAAEPFLKTLHRKEIRYQFFILNSDAVNAFSIPGGYVYVSRGLFDLIGEDDDDALQFAIGHEIAHVDLEHAIQCLRDPGVQRMTQGTVQKLYWLIIPFGYLATDTVDQEFDADRWVWTRMQGFGRTRREVLVFLQKLDGYAKSHGFGDGRGKPQPGRDISPLENHYRAQTAARKRLKHLKGLMDSSLKAPQ
jgi:hypothetical protein